MDINKSLSILINNLLILENALFVHFGLPYCVAFNTALLLYMSTNFRFAKNCYPKVVDI